MTTIANTLLALAAVAALVRVLRPGSVVQRAAGVEVLLVSGAAWVAVSLVSGGPPAALLPVLLVAAALLFLAGAIVAAYVNDRGGDAP